MTLSSLLSVIHREFGIPPTYGRERSLEPQVEAVESELIQIATSDEGRPIRLVPDAARAWASMRQSAARDDIELVPISGFRSVQRQIEIIREKLSAGQKIDDILRYVAAPGFSEHHTGRALDIGSPEHIELDEEFERTQAYQWLDKHAGKFGFRLSYPKNNPHGIGYEPWHWCWGRVMPGKK